MALRLQVPEEFTFTMEPGTVVGGIVRQQHGQAIAGAEVTVEGRKTPSDDPRWVCINDTVKTDAEGKWQVHRMPKDLAGFDLEVKVKRPDLAGIERFDMKTVSIDALRAQTAVLVLRKGVVVEGTVTDPQGKPAAGAAVGLIPTRFGSDYPRTKTDQNGRYRFAVSEPGDYTLAAAAKDCAPDSRRVTVDAEPQKVNLQLRKGEMIRLRVVDRDAKPMPGVVVSTVFNNKFREELMFDYQSAFERDNDRHMLADAEGRWSRRWIQGDEITCLISKPGYAQVQKNFAPGKQEYIVTLEAGGWSVSGRVVDHGTSAPVTKFRVVEGYTFGNRDHDMTWHDDRLVENKNGEYRATWDTSGDSHRVLRIEADGYLPSETRRLTVDQRQITFDVALSKGQEIAGTVRSPDNKPLANAEVALCTATRGLYLRNGRPLSDQPHLIARTGADGRFSFPPQREPYILLVLHDQGFAEIHNQQAMRDIAIQPWARVEGTLRIGKKPGVNEAIHLDFGDSWTGPDETRSPVERIVKRIINDYQTQTDAQGHFVFERVRAGNAKICRYIKLAEEGGGMTSWTNSNSLPVEFVPGRTLRVDLGGMGRPVTGRVALAENKSPELDFSGNAVYAHPSDRDTHFVARLNRDGSFRFDDLPAGEYRLSVQPISLPGDTPQPNRPRLGLASLHEFTVPAMPGGRSDEPMDLVRVRGALARSRGIDVAASREFTGSGICATICQQPQTPADKAAIVAARKVLEDVAATYKSLESYKAEGTVKMDVDTGSVKMNMETSFSILLKKPNLYRISWTQKNDRMPMVQSGAVWSDGTQPYLYMGVLHGYSKINGDEMALGAATGGSGGAAMTIMSLFLSVFKHPQQTPLARLKDPKIETTDKVEGEDCYVISGASPVSQKETLWISKSRPSS